MSLFAYLQGALVGSSSIRLRSNGDQAFSASSAADGPGGSQGSIVFDDPTGALTVTGWQSLTIDEPDCTARRLFSGYVADRTYRRGHYLTGAGREIDTTLNDQNVLLSLRLIDGSDGKRAAETDAARIAWLIGSNYLSGLVVNDGLVNTATPQNFDAADYRGQYPADVLSSVADGRTFFVRYNQTSGAFGLFFDLPTATAYTSTLTFSNVLADVDNVTVFNAYGAELVVDPSEVYSKERLTWVGGITEISNATTAANYFPSPLLSRGIQRDSSRIGKSATATTVVNNDLTRSSTERSTLSFMVRLPAAKVGLIEAGMRVSCKLSHLPGFTSFAYTRVERRTVTQTDGDPTNYDVQLSCSTYGLPFTGGGTGVGTFPNPPATATAVVQHKIQANPGVSGSITLASAPGVGNLLVAVVGWRGATSPPSILTGFTEVAEVNSVSAGLDCVYMAYRISVAGDTATFAHTATSSKENTIQLTEYSGSWSSPVGTFATGTAGGVHPQVTITPTAGSNGVVVLGAINADTNTPADTNYVAGSGYTLLDQANTVTNHPVTGAAYKIVSSASGSYSPDMTATAGFPGDGSASTWGAIAAMFVQVSAVGAPRPGTWIYGEVITMSGANGTTAFPFADGSLKVYVDNLDQTPSITTYDGAAGTFTLAFAPKTGEVVTVTYQGR